MKVIRRIVDFHQLNRRSLHEVSKGLNHSEAAGLLHTRALKYTSPRICKFEIASLTCSVVTFHFASLVGIVICIDIVVFLMPSITSAVVLRTALEIFPLKPLREPGTWRSPRGTLSRAPRLCLVFFPATPSLRLVQHIHC